MTTSPFQAPSWNDEDYVLLAQEPLASATEVEAEPFAEDPDWPDDEVDVTTTSGWSADDDDTSAWRRSTEYATLPGLPGRGITLVTTLATSGVAGLDFALTGGLSIFFDLCFVVIGLVGAMAVRRYDLFTTGVLTPLVFAATIAAVSIAAPETFTPGGGFSKVFMTGLAGHAGALVAAYAVALGVVFGRAAATHRR